MEYNTVGAVQVIQFLCIPFGYFLDWIILDQSIGAMELGGAAIICGVNIIINILKVKKIIDWKKKQTANDNFDQLWLS